MKQVSFGNNLNVLNVKYSIFSWKGECIFKERWRINLFITFNLISFTHV